VIDKIANRELLFFTSIGLLVLGSLRAFWMKPDNAVGDTA
jgi:hypothetical protein